MIKINLLGEKKARAKKKSPRLALEGSAKGQNLLLVGLLLVGVTAAAGWWWSLDSQIERWRVKHADADRELERLTEVRKKGEEYKAQKELLSRKIDLITELKKKQALPVHILDQVSRSIPEFLWLDQMSATANQISITGKATTYNAVTNFYNNLTRSGHFAAVDLGRTFEAADGISFSLTCTFQHADAEPAPAGAGA